MAKMNKTELYNAVVEGVTQVLDAQGIHGDTRPLLLEVLDKYLKPGVFGFKNNIEEVVMRDEFGNIVQLQCSLSKKWLPADSKHFYADKRSSKIIGTDGVALRRLSRQAEKCRKIHLSETNKAVNNIQKGIMNSELSAEDARVMLQEIKSKPIDFSSVGAPLVPVSGEDEE